MNDDMIEMAEPDSRRHSRDVTYSSGKWSQVSSLIPSFELTDFRAGDSEAPNPYLKAVVRLPLKVFERRIPVGVVSNSYPLAQHHQVAEQCFIGMRALNLEPAELKCDLGLTHLGEWMNLRIYFPTEYEYVRNRDDRLGLRVECSNSVDGSSRLVLFLSWVRFICSNGMIISDTMATLRDKHDIHLNLEQIPEVLKNALEKMDVERTRLQQWDNSTFAAEELTRWINEDVSDTFNKTAATRVFHICTSGNDVEIANPFAAVVPTEKPVLPTARVPGCPVRAQNLFDVGQALSWVATARSDAPPCQ
jgi:hypothetical protein